MRSAGCLGLVWAQFGPYHFARASALVRLGSPMNVAAIQIGSHTHDYDWNRAESQLNLVTLCSGSVTEELSFARVFAQARRSLTELGITVCLLPSYAPKQSTALLLAAKSLGLPTVMMNESHAGTARATGLTGALKRRLVKLFDAALVGGKPQKRYFTSLGMPQEKVFTGYDAVDNDYFSRRANEMRSQPSDVRRKYGLPAHYFLSLGRFVAKKNLSTLIRAFRLFLDASSLKQTHLVLVGSGQEEENLKFLCLDYGLPIYGHQGAAGLTAETANRKSQIANEPPGVHFYGFRQIEENPVFYALADAFILPSLLEEWGLVVNEAMASSLPVVVSETAGCAEDLLEIGKPQEMLASDVRSLLDVLKVRPKIRKNGFVFDPNSSHELSRILLFLESSPDARAAMGQAGRRIIDKFSCENFARNALLAAEAAMRQPQTPARQRPLEVATGDIP